MFSVVHTWTYKQSIDSKVFAPEHQLEPLPFAATILTCIIAACAECADMLIVRNLLWACALDYAPSVRNKHLGAVAVIDGVPHREPQESSGVPTGAD